MGSRARLGNGPAHQPRASSNSEPRSCDSACFLHSSRITVRPYSFRFRLPFLFSLFQAPATQRHPPPSNATHHSNCHHVACTSFTAAPSEHAATHAPNRRRLRHLFASRFRTHASHSLFLSFRLRFAAPPPSRAVSATKYSPRRRCLAMRTKNTKPLENRHGLACFVDNSSSRCVASLISSFLSSLTLPNPTFSSLDTFAPSHHRTSRSPHHSIQPLTLDH